MSTVKCTLGILYNVVESYYFINVNIIFQLLSELWVGPVYKKYDNIVYAHLEYRKKSNLILPSSSMISQSTLILLKR